MLHMLLYATTAPRTLPRAMALYPAACHSASSSSLAPATEDTVRSGYWTCREQATERDSGQTLLSSTMEIAWVTATEETVKWGYWTRKETMEQQESTCDKA